MCNVRNVRIFLGGSYLEIEDKTSKRAEGSGDEVCSISYTCRTSAWFDRFTTRCLRINFHNVLLVIMKFVHIDI